MRVSVITAVYNGAAYVADCIDSVKRQNYSNIEHVIIDGGSNDGTLEIINDKNEETVVLSEPDRGVYDGMNKGIRLATGDIVGMLNADDMYYDENVVSEIVNCFQKNPQIDCMFGNLEYVDRDDIDKVTRRWFSRPFEDGLFARSWTPAHPTFYCRRELYEKYGAYRLDFEIAADVELMYRFLQCHKVESLYLPRIMVRMRKAGISNMGVGSTIKITKEVRKAFKENADSFNLIIYLFHKALKTRQWTL